MRNAIISALQYIGMLLLAGILVLMFIVVVGAISYYHPIPTYNPPNPQVVYERAYNECIARETIEADRCHDMALIEAYGD